MEGSSLLDPGQIQWEETNRNFYQTLNKIRIQQGVPPVNHRFDPIGNLLNDRTVFVKIRNERYPISCDILDSIFSGFGILIGINSLRSGFHSTVHFVEKESTIRAFESLNGRNIYDDCCQLELFLVVSAGSSSNQERDALAEVEVENRTSEIEGALFVDDGGYQGRSSFEAPIADLNQETDSPLKIQSPGSENPKADSIGGGDRSFSSMEELQCFQETSELLRIEEIADKNQEVKLPLNSDVDSIDGDGLFSGDGVLGEKQGLAQPEEMANPFDEYLNLEVDSTRQQIQHRQPQVIPSLVAISAEVEVEREEVGELVVVLTEHTRIKWDKFTLVAVEILGNPFAPKVFVKMSSHVESSFLRATNIVKHRVQDGNAVFDPGVSDICIGLSKFLKPQGGIRPVIEFERLSCNSAMDTEDLSDLLEYNVVDMVFDPGGFLPSWEEASVRFLVIGTLIALLGALPVVWSHNRDVARLSCLSWVMDIWLAAVMDCVDLAGIVCAPLILNTSYFLLVLLLNKLG